VVFRHTQVWDRKSSGGARVLDGLRDGSGQKFQTRAELYWRNTAEQDKLSAGQWCWNCVSLANICPVANSFQLKSQLIQLTWIGSLELKIGSLESEKMIREISERVLQSVLWNGNNGNFSGPYKSIPGTMIFYKLQG